MLYASLTASLFSAFLAMLGEQWLNQYVSTNMRGTAIERSQNRQRKLNGIVNWYFEYVMESLPLMLQVALLLLGSALGKYLWGINATIALVVLGVTSFGITFYLFVVVAGAASESCPYQTPGSRILHLVPPAVVSAASTIRLVVKHSIIVKMFEEGEYLSWPPQSPCHAILLFIRVLCFLPVALANAFFQLGQATVKSLVALAHQVYTWLLSTPYTSVHKLDRQTTLLDLQCISWTLQTSLDKAVHLSALESLATMVELDNFYPTLVVDCFNIFVACTRVINNSVVITHGLEQLATTSATCFLHTFSHLLVTDPRSSIIKDVHHQYKRVFQGSPRFNDLPSLHVFWTISSVFNSAFDPPQTRQFSLGGGRLSNHEHIILSHTQAKIAQFRYQEYQGRSWIVSDWNLTFVLHSLFLDPLPPISVVVDCLSIIAIALGCNVPSTRVAILDKKYVYTQYMFVTLTPTQCTNE